MRKVTYVNRQEEKKIFKKTLVVCYKHALCAYVMDFCILKLTF